MGLDIGTIHLFIVGDWWLLGFDIFERNSKNSYYK
jgi:hypothetical protein